MFKYFLNLALVTIFSGLAIAQNTKERPNILWITSEDNDYGWLGCYGNEQAETPHLDKLAKEGVLFKNAYSNAPVCAVARSTILRGVYAVTAGTQHMRSNHKISPKLKPYVTYLREQGYYCTNKTKTDYNYDGPTRELWDDSTRDAHYKNRPEGAPFFSVVNFTMSHESSLFVDKIAKNRKKGLIPDKPRLSPSEVKLRPYLPDLPEIRSDIAIYHDNMTAMDKQVGEVLEELEQSGLADDTIVFYYSDHGGITPRGKRYLKETGVRVPMLLHIPEKWKHLNPFKNTGEVDEMVSFVDLAPTLLSLTGVETPEHMQGRAFLGKHRKEAPENAVVFLYADRFDEFYGMRRGLVTEKGKWKYIRRFTPHLPAAPYSFFQFGQEGWVAWQKAWQEGKLSAEQSKIWESNQAVEELYDLENDPWEVNNLASDKAQEARMQAMREGLREQMIANKDSGIIPEAMFAELTKGTIDVVTDYFDQPEVNITDLVNTTSLNPYSMDADSSKDVIAGLRSTSPVQRYWFLQQCLMGKVTGLEETDIKKALKDDYSANRVASAHTLFLLGKKEIATKALISEIQIDQSQYAILYALNVINQCGLFDQVPNAWREKILSMGDDQKYVKRMLLKMKK